ncbi:MAG TPA: sigma factor [Kofleriaceae bacterium]|nr:sigma factor [Kofleriaceae bacterium]
MDELARLRANQLLAALADGDRAAFDPLFQLLWPPVSRFASRALASASDGEEAAQEALMRLFERASEFDPDRDAVTWALTLAAWECRTVRRRRQRRKEVELPGDDHRAAAPVDVAAAQLEAAAVEVLGTLSPADVQVILASVMGGAGGRGDAAPATLRKRLERALARLRVAWRSRHGTL